MREKPQQPHAPGARNAQNTTLPDAAPAADPQLAGRRGRSAGLQPGGRDSPAPPRHDRKRD